MSFIKPTIIVAILLGLIFWVSGMNYDWVRNISIVVGLFLVYSALTGGKSDQPKKGSVDETAEEGHGGINLIAIFKNLLKQQMKQIHFFYMAGLLILNGLVFAFL